MSRILSALVLIPLVIALVFFGSRLLFTVFVSLLSALTLIEFYSLGDRIGARCRTYLGLGVGILLTLSPWYGRPNPVEILVVGYLLCGILILFSEDSLEKSVLGWMTTSFGWLYISLPLSLLYDLRFEDFGEKGSRLVLFLLATQWLQDTAAYYGGRAFGSHKIAPRFSPRKTIEGSLSGLLAVIIVGAVFHYWVFDDSRLGQIILLSLALGVAGQMGDFLESVFKRAAGRKDSSNLIPGHGGVLDRIDGLLFAAPVLWFALRHGSI